MLPPGLQEDIFTHTYKLASRTDDDRYNDDMTPMWNDDDDKYNDDTDDDDDDDLVGGRHTGRTRVAR